MSELLARCTAEVSALSGRGLAHVTLLGCRDVTKNGPDGLHGDLKDPWKCLGWQNLYSATSHSPEE